MAFDTFAALGRSSRSADRHHYRQPGVQGTGAARLTSLTVRSISECYGSRAHVAAVLSGELLTGKYFRLAEGVV